MASRLVFLLLPVAFFAVGTRARLHQNTKTDRQLYDSYNTRPSYNWYYGYDSKQQYKEQKDQYWENQYQPKSYENGEWNGYDNSYNKEEYNQDEEYNENDEENSGYEENDEQDMQNYQNYNQNQQNMEGGYYDEEGNWVNTQNMEGDAYDAYDQWQQGNNFQNDEGDNYFQRLKLLQLESEMDFYRLLAILFAILSLGCSLYAFHLHLDRYHSSTSKTDTKEDETLASSSTYSLSTDPCRSSPGNPTKQLFDRTRRSTSPLSELSNEALCALSGAGDAETGASAGSNLSFVATTLPVPVPSPEPTTNYRLGGPIYN